MKLRNLHKIIFWGCFTGTLFSCERDFKDVQNMSRTSFVPTSEVENFKLKYTDSTHIKSILISQLMFDFGNLDFPFTEFPKGIDLTVFDEEKKESYITSNYAITYSKTDIIDLQDNVKITSSNGDVLETSQLYYDRKREWFFTEKECKFTNENGVYYFKGFDSKSDLTQGEARSFSGEGNFSELKN
jgi:LPS export ABC transporter protein LptC